MSIRWTKWTLWIAFVLTVPVPYFMVETGWVPTARLFLFAALSTAVVVTEPGSGSGMIAGLFLVQAVAYGIVLFGLARFGARMTQRIAREQLRLIVIVLVVAGLFAGSLFPVFKTPLSNSGRRASLFGIFQ